MRRTRRFLADLIADDREHTPGLGPRVDGLPHIRGLSRRGTPIGYTKA